MATHLVSLLGDVEQALMEASAIRWGAAWNLGRALSEAHLVGRITLTPAAGAAPSQTRGAIFLQGEALPDGLMRFKASFHWHGSEAFPSVPVGSNSNAMGWKTEAARIAALWLAGPPATRVTPGTIEFAPFVALAS
ncbi:MAG TPA: hypothetical protein VHO24_17600 [Opitutaceae bacterium]|nr:hypothetical protein [Opitutaceae bacterium]